MLPLPASLAFPSPFPGPGTTAAPNARADTATARLIDEALAIRRQAGGDLGFFAAFRLLADHKVDDALAFDVLGRSAWRS